MRYIKKKDLPKRFYNLIGCYLDPRTDTNFKKDGDTISMRYHNKMGIDIDRIAGYNIIPFPMNNVSYCVYQYDLIFHFKDGDKRLSEMTAKEGNRLYNKFDRYRYDNTITL